MTTFLVTTNKGTPSEANHRIEAGSEFQAIRHWFRAFDFPNTTSIEAEEVEEEKEYRIALSTDSAWKYTSETRTLTESQARLWVREEMLHQGVYPCALEVYTGMSTWKEV